MNIGLKRARVALPLACALAGAVSLANAAEAPIRLVNADGQGTAIGSVTLADTPNGLQLTPALTGLPPGPHGFHVHANGSCDPASPDGKPVPAGAAGGHFDPEGHKHHAGPAGIGHLGDLPVLEVDADGRASKPVIAPRLKLADVTGKALMIHAGGDNYADDPAPLGGGGARIACGVVR
ncbi:superoxide dismutase family protein [Derxia lacustris]|uniref:superoxide dismutase family protein n=1 Tax=Derxia lacustris TaxID=764842 RepID=UPI000A1702D8|nr:superoxide dismutase family protein [Derxia lacustris]